ncbi:MAG: hypothetical protein HY805_02170, partial [Nitrospirae bacterium]|nr:hypothetical protein [Nitrospirota bacterium]
AGETISSPKVIVTGTIENFIGELGVTVNGIVADVYGNQFVVSNVPLVEGANTITVTAKDALRTTTSSITVNAVMPVSYIELSSNIESGIAPLTAYFSASISNLTPSSYQMDFEGDGIVDWTGASFEDISHTYTLEGIFYPTVVVTDSQGNSYWDVIAITVLSRAEMDALLKGKWEGMKSELAEGDVEGAMGSFDESSKGKYEKILIALKDRLPSIASNMGEIKMDYVLQDVAEYRISRIESINGQIREVTYFIYFVKDKSGLWKIESF